MSDFLQNRNHALSAVGVLLVLFCAFFWLGFFVGRDSAPRSGEASSPTMSEPVRWERTAI